MELELNEKIVLVTGGASNIGRSICLNLSREGAKVIVVDIDKEQAEATKEFIAQVTHNHAEVAICDVSNYDEVKTLFSKLKTQFGQIDVLVNGAGWDQLQYFTQTDPIFWEKIIKINFLSTLNCCSHALPIMISQMSGTIISISSDASKQGEPKEAVYGAMKAGINSFMKTLARENGRFGIRCNVICPGVTIPESPEEAGQKSMWRNIDSMFSEDQLTKIAQTLPLKKLGKPEDIANAVLFLASNKMSGHITGQVLSVSGGYSMT